MAEPASPQDLWSVGDAYERFIGRWSRLVAREFIAWLAPAPNLSWLDVGCGTGALSRTVLDLTAPARLLGLDPSAHFLALARAHTDDPCASFRDADAQALPVGDGTVDIAVSGLVLNFIPDRRKAAAEMARVVRPGGCVALYVWDYADGMRLLRHFWDAAIALDPAARELDEGVRFPVCRPQALAELLADAGLSDIAVRAIDVPTVFRDFDDYWTPFLGGQGPAPAYCMALPEDRRAALRDRLKATLPVEHDRSIRLLARAYAARGRRPESAAVPQGGSVSTLSQDRADSPAAARRRR